MYLFSGVTLRQNEFSDEVASARVQSCSSGYGTCCTSFGTFFKDYEGTAWNKHDASLETWKKVSVSSVQRLTIQSQREYRNALIFQRKRCMENILIYPKPDDVIFTGWFLCGEVFRSGLRRCPQWLWKNLLFPARPRGILQVYYIPEVQKIIKNAVALVSTSQVCEEQVR